jgi:hypothetical protein
MPQTFSSACQNRSQALLNLTVTLILSGSNVVQYQDLLMRLPAVQSLSQLGLCVQRVPYMQVRAKVPCMQPLVARACPRWQRHRLM